MHYWVSPKIQEPLFTRGHYWLLTQGGVCVCLCMSLPVCVYVCTDWLVQILNECLGMDHPYSGQPQFNGFCFCEKMRLCLHYTAGVMMGDLKEANRRND